MTAARPFLATKLSPPRLTEATLRPNLVEAVAAAADHKLLLVCAPAGYGKTTLVAEASRQLNWPAVWYKIDVFDHDVTVLIASLAEGIRTYVPSFAEVLRARLGDVDDADPPLDELLVAFAIALVEDTQDDLFLILDDYHEAADAADLNRALEYIIVNLPKNVHVVLLTRYEPGFPTRRMLLAGEATEIDFTALRFDATQVASLIGRRHNRTINAQQAEVLLEVTEGWPTSIVLAADALDWIAIESMGQALTDPRLKNDAYSYLAEQVFTHESDETKRFLKGTCCLESITVDLANQILAISDAFRHLDHLVRNHVFTFANADRSTYRYHNLFRDFLRHYCALEDGVESFRRLQVRTADALVTIASFDEATELYLCANQPDDALNTLARGGEATMENCRAQTLSSWLDRLPADLARINPWAHLLEAQLCVRDGRYETALALLAKADQFFAKADDRWGRYQTHSIKECALFWQGKESEAADCCRQTLTYACTDDQKVHTLISLGFTAINACAWATVDQVWSEIDSLRVRLPRERSRLDSQRVVVALYQGDFRTAQQAGRELLPRLAASGPVSLLAPFLNALALIDVHCGDYASASGYVDQCLSLCDRFGFAHFRRATQGTHGLNLLALGQRDLGLTLVTKAVSDPAVKEDTFCRASDLTRLGTAWRRAGDVQQAIRFYESVLAIDNIAAFPTVHLNCQANLEYSRRCLNQSAETSVLAEIALRAGDMDLQFINLKSQFLAACLNYAFGSQRNALDALLNLIPKQLQLGHISFLSSELTLLNEMTCRLLAAESRPDVVAGLLDALARHWDAPSVLSPATRISELVGVGALNAARLHLTPEQQSELARGSARSRFPGVRRLAAEMLHSNAPDHSPPRREQFPELTRREREILGLIVSGQSNRELAGQLCLSPATVKTHVNHIFTKLGVHDRVQVVVLFHSRMSADAAQANVNRTAVSRKDTTRE
jgi:LuxR family maltose regulon positive regulatory protein